MEDTKRAFISYSSPGLVLSRLFVVFQVELPDHRLKRTAHRVIVDTRRETEFRLEKVVDRGTDSVGCGECCELLAEFEILPNASGDLGRKPVEVVLEIGHSGCSLLQ
jgi:hypothetical protein